jgi:hypothetical protein
MRPGLIAVHTEIGTLIALLLLTRSVNAQTAPADAATPLTLVVVFRLVLFLAAIGLSGGAWAEVLFERRKDVVHKPAPRWVKGVLVASVVSVVLFGLGVLFLRDTDLTRLGFFAEIGVPIAMGLAVPPLMILIFGLAAIAFRLVTLPLSIVLGALGGKDESSKPR